MAGNIHSSAAADKIGAIKILSSVNKTGVYKQWTGLLEWWTGQFLFLPSLFIILYLLPSQW